MSTTIHELRGTGAVMEGNKEWSSGSVPLNAVGNVVVHFYIARVEAVVGDLLKSVDAKDGRWEGADDNEERGEELHLAGLPELTVGLARLTGVMVDIERDPEEYLSLP